MEERKRSYFISLLFPLFMFSSSMVGSDILLFFFSHTCIFHQHKKWGADSRGMAEAQTGAGTGSEAEFVSEAEVKLGFCYNIYTS